MHPKDLIRDSCIYTLMPCEFRRFVPLSLSLPLKNYPFFAKSGTRWYTFRSWVLGGRSARGWVGVGVGAGGGVVRYDVMWSTERCSESQARDRHCINICIKHVHDNIYIYISNITCDIKCSRWYWKWAAYVNTTINRRWSRRLYSLFTDQWRLIFKLRYSTNISWNRNGCSKI